MDVYVPDHYRVLGIAVAADGAAIKDAYRKLSRVYHPDRHGGSSRATSCFQYISSANTELSDPVKRLNYDRMLLLRDPLRMVDDPRADRALDVLDLVVKRLKRRPDALPGAVRGRDLRVRHTVDFALAALGGVALVQVNYDSVCGTCLGQGSTQPERNPVCHVCQGRGSVKHGLRRQAQECGFCGGRGAVLLVCCQACTGRGIAAISRVIGVQVPARTQTGAVLRARGVGEQPTLGVQPGDLVVEITITPHPVLSAEGHDLVVRVPITWVQALTGGSVQVPTLEGLERLTLPAEIAGYREIRVANRGLPMADGKRGALRVVVIVDCPLRLSRSQIATIEHWQATVAKANWPLVADYEANLLALAEPVLPSELAPIDALPSP